MPKELCPSGPYIDQEDNNLTFNEAPSPITQKEYLDKQIEIILSEENRVATKNLLGHEPTRNELGQYFVESGQSDEFRKKYSHRVALRKAS